MHFYGLAVTVHTDLND